MKTKIKIFALLSALLLTLIASYSFRVGNIHSETNLSNSCGDGYQESVSYTKHDASGSVPKITIKESKIYVKHRITGGGTIKFTHLTGSGGNYYLNEGENTVSPGTYSHEIIGNITTSSLTSLHGSIYSTVCYK